MPASVTLAFPADAQNLTLARQAAATMASRCGFSIDRVEDARLVTDEAVTLLIEAGAAGITCAFDVDGGALVVSATGTECGPIDDSGFAWMVMAALANGVWSAPRDGGVTITLRLTAEQPAAA